MRIAITGGPNTGKTTLAGTMADGVTVVHGDDFIGLGWSQSSQALADEMVRPGPWIAEGVQVPRALRKMLEAEPRTKPCDRLIVLGVPHREQSEGQRRMSLGVDTVLREIWPRLMAMGVECFAYSDSDTARIVWEQAHPLTAAERQAQLVAARDIR